MTARVYLMADFGGSQANKGPREVACHPLKSGRRVLGWEGYSPETKAHIIGAAQRQSCAGAPLRAWWLVEAESADAARRAIQINGKRVCEVCAHPLAHEHGRCTNGRCRKCHQEFCTPGGNDSPGHGRGVIATPYQSPGRILASGGARK